MASDDTLRYFERHRPEYSPARLEFAAAWMAEHLGPEASLVDVGCGSGNVLVYLRERTGLTDLTGVDPSPAAVERTGRLVGCPAHRGSVLDEGLADRLGRRFDVVLLAAVLHHLVGPTRRASRRLAREGLARALALTAPGGHLVVVEPVFEPARTMDLVFWVKRAVSAVYPRRLEILGRWSNPGAPVVSYLTEAELRRMAGEAGAGPVAEEVREREVRPLWRACGIRRRADLSLVLGRGR